MRPSGRGDPRGHACMDCRASLAVTASRRETMRHLVIARPSGRGDPWLHACMDCRVAALLAMTAFHPREATLPRHREATPLHPREAVRPWRSMTSCQPGLPRRYAPRNDSLSSSRGHATSSSRGHPSPSSRGHATSSSRGRQAVAIHGFMPAWIAALGSQ